jgi:hypothetical protein
MIHLIMPSGTKSMNSLVIAVRTANRPEILSRCISAAVEGCDVAQAAHWLVLDDSLPPDQAATQQVASSWQASGLRLSYIDRAVAAKIADSLVNGDLRQAFLCLTARDPACPTEAGRNLALIAALSLDSDVIVFLDDDMVHRHGEACFFHWCASARAAGPSLAAPRKRGIRDMAYLNRLEAVLDREDFARFIGEASLTADEQLWYSPANPLWKVESSSESQPAGRPQVLSGQFVALFSSRGDWLPFYDSDLNWTFLQSSLCETPLQKVSGIDVQHLPPSIGHLKAAAVVAELQATAITRALRQLLIRQGQSLSELAESLAEVLSSELRRELFSFLALRHMVTERAQATSDPNARAALSEIDHTLAEAAVGMKHLDARQAASAWAIEMASRREMLAKLRADRSAQDGIRRIVMRAIP